MKAKVSFQLGKVSYQLEIEEKSAAETLHKMAILGNPPTYCHECKNNQYFRLDSHKSGEYYYTEVVCTKCGAKATLTQKKDLSFYWKKFEKWNPQNKSNTTTSSDMDGEAPIEDDSIPF